MPDLPDVTQTFEANVAPYIAALRAAADAARDLARANAEAVASARGVGTAMRSAADGTDEQARAAEYLMIISGQLYGVEENLGRALIQLEIIQKNTADASLDLMYANTLLTSSFDRLDAQIDEVIAHLAALKIAQTGTAADSGRAAQIFLGGWRIGLNALHWIIAATIEFLAVALPAAIALAVGAFVLYQGVVEDVARRMSALYTATEATANMLHTTAGDALGLGHAFQTAQDAANPIAYQLLGNYINIARAHMVNLAAAGLAVARAVGELGARIQVDLLEHGSSLNSLLANMVPDLIEFGQILGNIGHAILNLASDMPGLAEVLLQIADGISRVILWISELPRWLILGAAALEEFIRWGGGVVGLFSRMGFGVVALEGKFFSFARVASVIGGALSILPAIIARIGTVIASTVAPELGIFAEDAFAAGVAVESFGKAGVAAIGELSTGWLIGIGLAAVGLGILIDKLVTARSDAQMFGDQLEAGIAKASNVQVLGILADDIGKVNTRLSQTPTAVSQFVSSYHGMSTAASAYDQQAQQLTQTQQHMIGQFASVTTGADKISRAYGTTFAGSLALADMAGVKLANTEVTLGRNANIAGAQIEGLVQGYARLNQTGGILNNDMNVLAVQSGLAGSKVQALNQAWDQFMQNSTGLTSSLATLNQDLTQVGNVGVAVGGAFRVFEGQARISINAVAQSLTSFSGRSAQTWQNYDAALNQASQFTDQLRVASAYGAISQRNYTGSIADTVLAMLPFAAKSKTAVEELSALAQQAGGPATDNFKTLKDWVDKNKISTDALDKAIQIATGDMSNAGRAAQEFASTLQSQMQTDLANALLSQSNLNSAVGKFQQAVLASGGQIRSSSPQYRELYSLLRAAGLSAAQARAEMQMLQNTIDGLHGKTININTVYTQSGTPVGSGGPGGMGVPKKGQHGGVISGTFGTDHIPMLLSAGEAIMNARAVSAMGGPLAIHRLNNTPSEAILSGSGSGGITVLHVNLNVPVELDGTKVASGQRTRTLIYDRRNPSNNLSLRVR